MFCFAVLILIYQEDMRNWRVFLEEQVKSVDKKKRMTICRMQELLN